MTILSNIAMALLVLGTIPSVISVVKSRKNLDGFNLFGASAIVSGQIVYFIYFALLGDILTTIEVTPIILFWLLVIIYKVKSGVRSDKKKEV